ncbi:MAG: DNA polymerase III subunit delta' [Ardenticatenaceae bacterium]|nr:DNA polymerase III subunit delta' [Ardenticatenaceae bacterium]
MTTWQNIIGHDWAVELLANSIRHDRVGHAYLITGLEQVGKTTLARTLAQALNCLAADVGERPCGQCRACKLIAVDRHPDVRLVEPEVSGRGQLNLKIEAMRQLQRDLNLAAYEARTKVAILKRFDAANANAANAFLKTLEEPPNNVVLLLTAVDADTLLDTINSRCRNLHLRPINADLIEQSLAVRWQVPAREATLLAHLADGRLGWAVQAAKDSAVLTAREAQLAALYEALAGNRVTRFALADKLAKKAEELPDVFKTWLSWWRDVVLLTQAKGQSTAVSNIDQQEKLVEKAKVWTADQALNSLQQTNHALWQLARNANTRLVLENLLLVYPLPSS